MGETKAAPERIWIDPDDSDQEWYHQSAGVPGYLEYARVDPPADVEAEATRIIEILQGSIDEGTITLPDWAIARRLTRFVAAREAAVRAEKDREFQRYLQRDE